MASSNELEYWQALLAQKQAILANGAHPAYIEELQKEIEALAKLIATEQERLVTKREE
jgi:hypothetical protein